MRDTLWPADANRHRTFAERLTDIITKAEVTEENVCFGPALCAAVNTYEMFRTVCSLMFPNNRVFMGHTIDDGAILGYLKPLLQFDPAGKSLLFADRARAVARGLTYAASLNHISAVIHKTRTTRDGLVARL